jgi:hypothetical protein
MLAAALAWAARSAGAAGGRLTLLDGASRVHPCPWAQSSSSSSARPCPDAARGNLDGIAEGALAAPADGMHTVRALSWGITVTAAARPPSSERRRRDGPGHWRPSRPGLFLPDRGRPYPSPRSAANPASHPSLPRGNSAGLLPPAAGRLVTGLSRVSCRAAGGLAALMRAGLRAELPGVSQQAAPPGGQARAHHRPGPADQHLLRLSSPPSPAWPGGALPAERAPPQAQALPAPGKPGPQADTSHTPSTPPAPADSARQPPPAAGGAGGWLAGGSRAGGQVAAAGRAGLPTVLRCRSAWA